MASQIFILACGGAFLDRGFKVNRHLIPIAGEPLILRQIRQHREYAPRALPIVVTHHEDIKKAVIGKALLFEPPAQQRRWYPETLWSTIQAWDDHTAVFMGDAVYPDEVVSGILRFLARDDLFIHGKPYGDFDAAVTFSRKHHRRVALACHRAVKGIEEYKAEHGKDAWVGSTGPFMRALHDIDLWTAPDKLDYEYHRVIDVGFSKDFDRPGQYDAWLKNNEWAT